MGLETNQTGSNVAGKNQNPRKDVVPWGRQEVCPPEDAVQSTDIHAYLVEEVKQKDAFRWELHWTCMKHRSDGLDSDIDYFDNAWTVGHACSWSRTVDHTMTVDD